MKKLSYIFLVAMLFVGTALSSCSKDDDEFESDSMYQIVNINGKDYACYGYSTPITYDSTWDNAMQYGCLRLPCGELSDAQEGEFDYDYMYQIYFEGNSKPNKGTDIAKYSKVSLDCMGRGLPNSTLNYKSGAAIVKEVIRDGITVEFKDFKFSDGSHTYSFNKTVKLSYDED